MSDQGEKTCPLCAEEMDLTDQQLKPCKCGYEICVWCWHQIMDMAEKNETEGRCPACRTPYNKEKIVGTAANCGRLVSEINVDKRAKSQKGKSKTEGRKNLASVRVIQRHLVYVIGMPLNLADEDLLQRREYFGQYGKVLKISISRTAGGAIQQFSNSTCSVYVTYSNEDEAVRCIQSVQGFVLDGKPLKACFGTTKYCHAWLRNAPCSNPDCVYLHEVGSQANSFTKDEIISDYTRDRLQQNTSSVNPAQRRSGNALPSPADMCCSTGSMSSGKPPSKTNVNTNNSAIGARISPPNSSSGRSAALPPGASWGTRTSGNQLLPASSPCSTEPPKTKPDTHYIPVTSSNTVASQSQQSSLQHDTGEKLALVNDSNIPLARSKAETLELVEQESKTDGWNDVSDSSSASWFPATSLSSGQPHAKFSTKQLPSGDEIPDTSLNSDKAGFEIDPCDTADENVNNLCSDISAISINDNQHVEIEESVFAQTSGEFGNIIEMPDSAGDQSDLTSIPAQAVQVDLWDMEDDLLSFESQRVSDPEVSINRIPKFSNALHLSGHPNIHSSPFNNADDSISDDLYRKVVGRNSDLIHALSNQPSRNQEHALYTNGAEVNDVGYFNLFPSKEKKSLLGSYEGEMSFDGASNRGERCVISNILSMDFDPWNESLTSPQKLVKLLGELDNKQGFSRAPGPRRIPNNNQSRFLFAREEESVSQASSAFGQSVDYFGKGSKQHPFGFDFSSSNSSHIDKFDTSNDFSLVDRSESDIFASNSRSQIPSNKLSVPRLPIAAPPGFSVPSTRAPPPPPPGFAHHGRTEQLLDNIPGNHMFDNSYWSVGNQYQTPESGKIISDVDLDFADPAILAVGRGMLPSGFNSTGIDISQNFTQRFNNNVSEEARFQSLFNRSLSQQQNQRYSNPLGDDYAIPSRVMEQTLANSVSSFSQSRNGMNSNGQWNGWGEVQGGKNMNMGEYLRTERLGISNYYGGYEDSKIRMPSSGNLFNGTYGI